MSKTKLGDRKNDKRKKERNMRPLQKLKDFTQTAILDKKT